jgi:BirA family biotin operon repressor/biotin-[acetyl-CoA-carboxylase] ligase
MTRFDVARFEAERNARRLGLGAPLAWRDSTESTNDDALTAAKAGAPHGALFGAETQRRGRGRRGSAWSSAAAQGLWFSLLLRPELSAEATPGLALCAGLAVREAAAARVSSAVTVKWPNDVLAGSHKLAGVLVESQVSGARLSSVVVGVGINVEQREFGPELTDIATSLARLEAGDRAREPLLVDVLLAFETRLELLQARGIAGLVDELRLHDALVGRRLRVDEREGTAAGIDDAGRLLLQLDDGALEAQLSGHVQIMR